MQKYITQILDYWYYKVLLGLWASFWSEDLPILFLLFIGLEVADVLTRWLALTYDWFKKTYPQSPCNPFICLRWMWQARCWRWIKSDGLRDGFCNKMLVYMILIFVAASVDAALKIAHMPVMLLAIVTTTLTVTEALSIFENLSECGVGIIKTISEKLKAKADKIV